MVADHSIFWIFGASGAVLAGWWLSVRPGASCRDLASPVSFLAVVLAVMVCLLTLTGQDIRSFGSTAFSFVLGH